MMACKTYVDPFVERSLGLGASQSLILGTCPQLPTTYCYHFGLPTLKTRYLGDWDTSLLLRTAKEAKYPH